MSEFDQDTDNHDEVDRTIPNGTFSFDKEGRKMEFKDGELVYCDQLQSE